jgi:hypothetical protein
MFSDINCAQIPAYNCVAGGGADLAENQVVQNSLRIILSACSVYGG